MNDTLRFLVDAIRKDEVVGVGTCSCVDEAMTDEEIADHLNRARITTVSQAVKEMRRFHELFLSRERDCRFE